MPTILPPSEGDNENPRRGRADAGLKEIVVMPGQNRPTAAAVQGDFEALIDPLARHFFGDPNLRMSSQAELRFGTHGSLAVDLEKSVWHNHETLTGGGVLDLVKAHKGFTETRDALQWLETQGWTRLCRVVYADFLAVRWRLSLRGTANITEGQCPKAICI
jgi:hypothetical protein